MQRLTSLCSVLNDMEPIGVLNHVFVLREVCTIYVHCEVDMHDMLAF
jgi:adenosine/AMP kinase